MLRFKPKKGFTTIDSDIYIDFLNKKVEFPNPRTIFDSEIIGYSFFISVFLDFVILLVFFLTNPFSSPDFTVKIISICVYMFLTIPFSYAYVLFMIFLSSPIIEKRIRKIKEKMHKTPKSRDVIEHPYRVKVTMYSSFELTFIGECVDYREKVYYSRKNHTLEVTFTKPCRGQLIIESW